MLRDTLVGLIEPMRAARELNPLALFTEQKRPSDDRPPCLENPRPEGAESTLTENAASPFQAEPAHKSRGTNQLAQEDTKVNFHIPADRIPGILSLGEEWSRSREATVEEMHRSFDGFIKMIERRIAFFDRLILLAGGSFALSLTLVSTLHKTAQNADFVSAGCLKAAWVLMLVCIIFSWIPGATVSEIHASLVHLVAGHDSCCYRVVVPGSRFGTFGAKDICSPKDFAVL